MTEDNAIQPRIRWQPVPNFKGIYEVSEYGDVRRCQKRRLFPKGSLVKPSRDRVGYLRIQLYDSENRRRVTFAIHRLVMLAFVGACSEGYEVNHIDGDKTNNHVSNLEYVTHRENVRHSFNKLGRIRTVPRGEKSGQSKLTTDQILEIRERVAMGETRRAIAARFGVSHVTITYIINGKTWGHV